MKLRMLWHLVDCAFPLPAAAHSCRRAEAEPAVLTASALTLKSGGRIYEVTAEWLRCHLYDGVQADAVAAFSWRIYHNGVGVDLVLFILFRQYLLRFSNKELDIFKMVQLCVGTGIINRLRNNLYAIYFLCFLRQKQGDGSDTAVKIPHGFLASQACILQSGSVKFLGLHRIDLIKGQWRDAIADISDIIGDIARSI